MAPRRGRRSQGAYLAEFRTAPARTRHTRPDRGCGRPYRTELTAQSSAHVRRPCPCPCLALALDLGSAGARQMSCPCFRRRRRRRRCAFRVRQTSACGSRCGCASRPRGPCPGRPPSRCRGTPCALCGGHPSRGPFFLGSEMGSCGLSCGGGGGRRGRLCCPYPSRRSDSCSYPGARVRPAGGTHTAAGRGRTRVAEDTRSLGNPLRVGRGQRADGAGRRHKGRLSMAGSWRVGRRPKDPGRAPRQPCAAAGLPASRAVDSVRAHKDPQSGPHPRRAHHGPFRAPCPKLTAAPLPPRLPQRIRGQWTLPPWEVQRTPLP